MKIFKLIFVFGTLLTLLFFTSKPASAVLDSGYLSGPGASYSFSINGPTELVFTYPKGSAQFWVTTVQPNGAIYDFNLDNGEIITLTASGTHYLTIYSDWGAGYWSVDYYYADGGGSVPSECYISGNTAWGYLTGPGDSCTWTLYSSGDNFSVYFTYPSGYVDFWVEVYDPYFNLIDNYDLDNGTILIFPEDSYFEITIYSNSGYGDWSCTW